MMEESLLIELIHCTKSTLGSIKRLAQLSRRKLNDKEYGDYFYKVISKDIGEHNLLLNVFLRYIESTTPITKKDTVSNLIEEVLKKQHLQLGEKKARIFKKYEKDLPETIVPDEKLRFILDSILRYTIASVDYNGIIELSARSIILSSEGVEDHKGNGNVIEIMASYKKEEGKGIGVPPLQERVAADLIFRLVEGVVKMNQGAMRFEFDEMESKHGIFVRFPTERRKVIYYQTADELKRTLASLE